MKPFWLLAATPVLAALPALAAPPADPQQGPAKPVPGKSTPSKAAAPHSHQPARGHRIDLSGRPQVGKASFYARQFAGRKMADGKPMDPRDDNAASKTLPLGTKALVTNLETGRSAVVTIQDRGPYVDGRIVDLSPATAEKIGLSKEEGLAQVEVAPIAVPMPDGTVKPGAGAGEVADAR